MFSAFRLRSNRFISVPDLANEVLLSRMGARRPGREEYSNDVVLDIVGKDKISTLADADLGDGAADEDDAN